VHGSAKRADAAEVASAVFISRKAKEYELRGGRTKG
jgi:hypothetical protein